MYLFTYIQYLNSVIRGIRARCKPVPGNYKQTRSRSLGPMPFVPGCMPFVTKDLQVRYVYGVGWVPLVTNYIRILLSYICTVWAECHSSLVTGPGPGPVEPTPPFGVLKARVGALALEQYRKFLWAFIKFSVYYLWKNDRISELGTIRGDRTTNTGKKYNEVLSPRVFDDIIIIDDPGVSPDIDNVIACSRWFSQTMKNRCYDYQNL